MINDFQQEIDKRKLALKKDIKVTGANCAKMLLILAISTYAIVFGTIFVMKYINVIPSLIANGSYDRNAIPKFSKDASTFFTGYLPCIIGDIIAIIIGMKVTKIKIRQDIFSKNKSSKMFVFLGAISCIGMGMISTILFVIYSTILQIAGITIPQPDFSLPKQSGYLVLFLLYVCFLGPVLEEIIFRGFILKSMQRYGNFTAIIVSSILFSMFHLNLVQFVNPVLMGIVLAFIATKSKSIIPSIIAHIFNNTITFLMSGVSSLKMPLIAGIIVMIYLLVGVIALTLFIYNYKEDFFETIKEDTRILRTYEKVKLSFSGPWAIAYIIFYIAFITITTVLTNIFK